MDDIRLRTELSKTEIKYSDTPITTNGLTDIPNDFTKVIVGYGNESNNGSNNIDIEEGTVINWDFEKSNHTDFGECFDDGGVINGVLNWSYFNNTKCTLIPQ